MGTATRRYSCKECGRSLNLSSNDLYPSDTYFEAGNKNSLSFSRVDAGTVRLESQDKLRPFFETSNYWGIHRKETTICCNNCGNLLGHVYGDGPPTTNSPGQFHFGPSQVIPRNPRFRLKMKALLSHPDS